MEKDFYLLQWPFGIQLLDPNQEKMHTLITLKRNIQANKMRAIIPNYQLYHSSGMHSSSITKN